VTPAAQILKGFSFKGGSADVVAVGVGLDPQFMPVLEKIASHPDLALNIDPARLSEFIADVGATTVSGAARTGAALLSGLLRCGQCGRKLQVVYSGNKGRVPRYICRGDRGDRGNARCQTVGSLRLDRAVVRCVLDAIQPVGIEAAINVAASTRAEDDAKKASLELALERARYEANRARRQFDAVDPENRLVASELEARWNRCLAQIADLEHRLTES
jgi:hypothetical protein